MFKGRGGVNEGLNGGKELTQAEKVEELASTGRRRWKWSGSRTPTKLNKCAVPGTSFYL